MVLKARLSVLKSKKQNRLCCIVHASNFSSKYFLIHYFQRICTLEKVWLHVKLVENRVSGFLDVAILLEWGYISKLLWPSCGMREIFFPFFSVPNCRGFLSFLCISFKRQENISTGMFVYFCSFVGVIITFSSYLSKEIVNDIFVWLDFFRFYCIQEKLRLFLSS